METLLERGGALFEFGLILLVGYLFGSLANLFRLPRVSGYILAGIVMSPSLLGIIDRAFLENAEIVTHASLSVITFLIGSSLVLGRLRKLGKVILLVTFGEAELAFLLVAFTMFFYILITQDIALTTALALALLFGALGSPTDPAATLAVIHEYRAKGVLTTTVLGVAALDDALGIVNFVLGFSLGMALLGSGFDFGSIGMEIVREIFGAIILGSVMGYGMHLLGRFARERKETVTVTMGVLFVTFSLARILGFDELLSTMTAGITLVNVDKDNYRFREPLENYIEDVLFTAFFVIGSAFLELKTLIGCLPFVAMYIGSRFAGKFLGAYLGGHLSGAPQKVKKYLALALFPQGGIVIGLALLAYQNPNLKEVGPILVNVVIGATVIHELLGPISSKLALTKAGEISRELS